MLRLTSLVVISLFGTVFGAVLPDGRIIGGQDAEPGQFPHQVSLRNALNRHFCGGSIIGERWVITAAHCAVVAPAPSTHVYVGALKLNEGGIAHRIYNSYIHNEYDMKTLKNDIALLYLLEPIKYTDSVKPIDLGENIITEAVGAQVSGWGHTSVPSGSASNYMQWMEVNVISLETCRGILKDKGVLLEIFDTNMCTDPRSKIGMCYGDSGGPLTHEGRLHGIVSWTINECAAGYPDGFVRVSSYIPWIKEIMNPS